VRKAYENFDFGLVNSTLFNFCTNDLSAFYFDIRKDALYCDAASSARRRSVRTVTDEIFRRIVTWFAPILCFTMEEAWTMRFGMGQSVHLNDFFSTPEEWVDPALIVKWEGIRSVRSAATGALEIARQEKKIGTSLQASPTIFVDEAAKDVLSKIDFEEILITSGVKIRDLNDAPENTFDISEGAVRVLFEPASGGKCARCWRVLEETRADTHLCNRCTDAVGALEPA